VTDNYSRIVVWGNANPYIFRDISFDEYQMYKISGDYECIMFLIEINRSYKGHRLDGPAKEFSTGKKVWMQYGMVHNDEGPAIVDPEKKMMWWFKHGKCVTGRKLETYRTI